MQEQNSIYEEVKDRIREMDKLCKQLEGIDEQIGDIDRILHVFKSLKYENNQVAIDSVGGDRMYRFKKEMCEAINESRKLLDSPMHEITNFESPKSSQYRTEKIFTVKILVESLVFFYSEKRRTLIEQREDLAAKFKN